MQEWTGKGVAAVGLALALAAPAAAQEEKSWSVEVGVDYSTLYMFRGLNLLGEDQAVWTPYASIGLGNWSIWYYGYAGKFDAFDDEGEPASDGSYFETDLGIDYTFSFGEKFALTVGGLVYLYDQETQDGLGYLDTTELYAIASWDILLAPTLSYYQDIDAIDGGFFTLDISHELALTESLGMSLMGQVGLDFGYNQLDDPEAGIKASNGDPNHVMVGVDLPLQLTESFSAHLLVQRFISLQVAEDLEQPDETVFTVGGTFSF